VQPGAPGSRCTPNQMGVGFFNAQRSATIPPIRRVALRHLQLLPPATQFPLSRGVRPVCSVFREHAPPLLELSPICAAGNWDRRDRIGMDGKRSGKKNRRRDGANISQPRACPELVEGLASKERTRTWGTGRKPIYLRSAKHTCRSDQLSRLSLVMGER
jgi:hypothetical protein